MTDFSNLREVINLPRFRRYLYMGIMKIEDEERRLKAAFAFITTLLTLRRSSAAHMRELWIDWKQGTIRTPPMDPCNCIVCWRQAHEKWLRQGFHQLAEKDYWDEEIENFGDIDRERWSEIVEEANLQVEELEDLVTKQYRGKSENWSRTIPFGFSRRATAILIAFFEEFDYWDESARQIRDLLKEGAENMEELEEEFVHPHLNRSGGISFFAQLFPDWTMLREVSGHGDIKNTQEYLRQHGRLITHQAYIAAGREEGAPPVIPENPEAAFPVLLDPEPFEGEREMFEYVFNKRGTPEEIGSPEMREEKHKKSASSEYNLVHPRDFNLPSDRAAFPASEVDRPDRSEAIETLFNVEEDEEYTIKGNTTLREFQSPHSLPPVDEAPVKPGRQPTDPKDAYESKSYVAFPSSSVLIGTGILAKKASQAVKSFVRSTKNRWIHPRKIEIAQMLQAVANYINPSHPASVNYKFLGTLLCVWSGLVLLTGIVLAGSEIYTNSWARYTFVSLLCTGMYTLPVNDLDMADILPVKRQSLSAALPPYGGTGINQRLN